MLYPEVCRVQVHSSGLEAQSQLQLQEKRKTINGDDLLWAMGTLGFERYVEPLRLYLIKYRETAKAEK